MCSKAAKKGGYRKKTDWICNHCGNLNDVLLKTCTTCLRKRQGNEKRL